jgi:hypothetical protein
VFLEFDCDSLPEDIIKWIVRLVVLVVESCPHGTIFLKNDAVCNGSSNTIFVTTSIVSVFIGDQVPDQAI